MTPFLADGQSQSSMRFAAEWRAGLTHRPASTYYLVYWLSFALAPSTQEACPDIDRLCKDDFY